MLHNNVRHDYSVTTGCTFMERDAAGSGCGSLCALEDRLSQCRVALHGRRHQGGQQRQIPDGRGVRNGDLGALDDLVAHGLQTVNARVAAIAQATFDVDLDICSGGWELYSQVGGTASQNADSEGSAKYC